MGQKVHPLGFRIGIIENWRALWFSKDKVAHYLGEDMRIRQYIKKRLRNAGIAKVEIERAAARVRINIYSAKPGLVIGKKGKDIEEMRKDLRGVLDREVSLNIIEARKADMDAQLVAESVAFQLERRVNFRRAAKEAVAKAMRMGAEGVKIRVAGRLNGAEIARAEQYKDGRIPLHTLRAEIDYGTARANTTYGVLGVKVWVFKGERFAETELVPAEAAIQAQ